MVIPDEFNEVNEAKEINEQGNEAEENCSMQNWESMPSTHSLALSHPPLTVFLSFPRPTFRYQTRG